MQERRKLGREIKRCLCHDRQNLWLKKAEEMESAAASGNSSKLFQLIRQTGPRKAHVSEVIEEADGTSIFNQKRRLDRWAEYFQLHFSIDSHPRPDATLTSVASSVWAVSNDPSSVSEIQKAVNHLQLKRAAGPDDLYPAPVQKWKL